VSCLVYVFSMRCFRRSFNGQTYIDGCGYLRFKDTGESVDRKVAEKMLRRPLRENDAVRHINGDKLDNRAKNLYVVSSRR
jgi:HNH endonuclease